MCEPSQSRAVRRRRGSRRRRSRGPVLTQTHPQTTALGLGLSGLVFGCDYNPEQWSRDTWTADVALMREAGVNLVAINIFGWSHVEPTPGDFRFDDLDTIIDLLHANGIGVNLGT